MQILGKLSRMLRKNNLDMSNIPKHIGIIMDGNGRWAKERGLPRSAGHRQGAETLKKIAETCQELGVHYLTVYAFSTENWKRPKEEVEYLMTLLREYIEKLGNDKSNTAKIKILGDITKLPTDLQEGIIKTEELTKDNSGLQLNIALNYGGRDEIHNAVKKMFNDYKKDIIADDYIASIDSEKFSSYLYTSGIPDPDLIIRPSGELRISNFLLYQCAYSEFWFANINWPDFSRKHLKAAIYDYQYRNRRFGGV